MYVTIYKMNKMCLNQILFSTLLHSEQPKLHRVLAVLSAIGLKSQFLLSREAQKGKIHVHEVELLPILTFTTWHIACFILAEQNYCNYCFDQLWNQDIYSLCSELDNSLISRSIQLQSSKRIKPSLVWWLVIAIALFFLTML